jgi:hypothetical protein
MDGRCPKNVEDKIVPVFTELTKIVEHARSTIGVDLRNITPPRKMLEHRTDAN